MEWLEPRAFWLLLLLVPLAWLGWKAFHRVPRLLVPQVAVLRRGPRSLRSRGASLPLLMRILALAMLVAALARPVHVETLEDSKTHGVDILLAFDVSTSMQIRDMKPDRLEVARGILRQFIAGRTHDRLGLIAFAGRPVTRAPLTADREVVVELLDSTSHAGLEDGTAIGDALLMAGSRLRRSDARSRVVVLLTDGENNAGSVDPVTAAKALAALGIRIYTITVGKPGTYFQDFILPDGTRQQGRVDSKIDAKAMRDVSRITGGRYWHAENREALAQAYDEIDRLERSEIEVTRYYLRDDRFAPWALGALALVLLAVLLEATWLRRLP